MLCCDLGLRVKGYDYWVEGDELKVFGLQTPDLKLNRDALNDTKGLYAIVDPPSSTGFYSQMKGLWGSCQRVRTQNQ